MMSDHHPCSLKGVCNMDCEWTPMRDIRNSQVASTMTDSPDHVKSNKIALPWFCSGDNVENDTHGHDSCLEDPFVDFDSVDGSILFSESSFRSLNMSHICGRFRKPWRLRGLSFLSLTDPKMKLPCR
jgi:hypothetical protein